MQLDASGEPYRDQHPRPSAHTPPVRQGCARPAAHSADRRAHGVTLLGVVAPIRVSGHRDARAAAIAAGQRGIVSRSQLRQAGVGDDAIDRMVASGHLHRLHPTVYALGHAGLPELARETAALLSAGDGAVLSHFSAAELWRLLRGDGRADIDVLVVGRATHSRRGIVVHRTRSIDQRDLRLHRGLPTTSVARTLLDLAERASMRSLERAVDEALISRLVNLRALEDVVARAVGRRGAPRLAALIRGDAGKTRTRSDGEELLLAFVRSAGLPMPIFNARIHGYEVDCLWPDQRLVVEFDSYRFHSSRSAFERDRRKGAVLTAAGLRVMHATWVQLEEEPMALAVRIAQALSAWR